MDGLYPEWDEFYLLVCDICGIVIRPQALKKHLATKHRINVQDQAQQDQPQAFQKHQQHNHHLPQPQPQQQQQQQPQQQQQNNHHHQQQQPQHQQQQQQQHQSLPPPPSPHQQPPKTNHINQTLPNNHNSTNSTHSTSSNSCVNNRPQTNGIAQQQPIISNQTKLWGGKHALNSLPKPAIKRRPCDWVKVRRAPVTNLDQLGSFVTKASHTVDNSSLTGSGMLHFNEFYGDVSSKTSSKYQDRKWRNTFNVLRDAFF